MLLEGEEIIGTNLFHLFTWRSWMFWINVLWSKLYYCDTLFI